MGCRGASIHASNPHIHKTGCARCTNIPSPRVRGTPIPRMDPKAVLEKALAWAAAVVTSGMGCGEGDRLDSDTELPMSKPGSGGCMPKSKCESSTKGSSQELHTYVCRRWRRFDKAKLCRIGENSVTVVKDVLHCCTACSQQSCTSAKYATLALDNKSAHDL